MQWAPISIAAFYPRQRHLIDVNVPMNWIVPLPSTPLTVSPRSVEINCELFSRSLTGTWHVIQDSPGLGCGAVGMTLRKLWNGIPACNAPVFDL